MTRPRLYGLGILLLALAFVLHYDFWWWDDPSLVVGLPIGMLFHIVLCLGASAIFALLVATAPEP